MAGNTTATTNFSKLVNILIRRDLEHLLRTPPPHLMPENYVRANFVPGTSGTMRFLSIPDMSVTTGTPTPGTAPWLTEGVPPAEESLAIAFEELTAYQAGRLLSFTDVEDLEAPAVMAVASERLARNMIMTADKYIADIINAGTSVVYAGGTSLVTVAAGNVMTINTIRQAVAVLSAAGVPKFADGTYHAINHPFVTYDITKDTTVGGWTNANTYTNNDPLLSGEIGRILGVRFMESNQARIFTGGGAAGINVYSTVVFGPDAFAFGDFQTGQVYVTPPGGQSDPLHQKTKIGWKAMFGARTLEVNGPRYVRILSSSSAAGA